MNKRKTKKTTKTSRSKTAKKAAITRKKNNKKLKEKFSFNKRINEFKEINKETYDETIKFLNTI